MNGGNTTLTAPHTSASRHRYSIIPIYLVFMNTCRHSVIQYAINPSNSVGWVGGFLNEVSATPCCLFYTTVPKSAPLSLCLDGMHLYACTVEYRETICVVEDLIAAFGQAWIALQFAYKSQIGVHCSMHRNLS